MNVAGAEMTLHAGDPACVSAKVRTKMRDFVVFGQHSKPKVISPP